MTTPHTFKLPDDSTSFITCYNNREISYKIPENLIKVNRNIIQLFFTDPANFDLVHFGVIKVNICDEFGNILYEYCIDNIIEIKRSDSYIKKRIEKCVKDGMIYQTKANSILQDKTSLIWFCSKRKDHIKLKDNTATFQIEYANKETRYFEVPKNLRGKRSLKMFFDEPKDFDEDEFRVAKMQLHNEQGNILFEWIHKDKSVWPPIGDSHI